MKMSVQFYFDRFIIGKVDSVNEHIIGNYGGRNPFFFEPSSSPVPTSVSQQTEVAFNSPTTFTDIPDINTNF